MYSFTRYFEPLCLEDALELLDNELNPLLIAGGTDILIKMRKGAYADTTLVSLRKINELRDIQLLKDGSIRIGPMVTFNQIITDNTINERVPVLVTAAKSMGGPQIRNVATIGGNICNAAPSADSAPSLLVLNSMLEFTSARGCRVVPIDEYYLGPYKTCKQSDEILTSIIIPSGDKYSSSHYIKYSMRKAMDISTLGCAVMCVLQDDCVHIKYSRIALGTAAPKPIRCKEAEKILKDKEMTEDLLREVGIAAQKDANPRTSWRATREFRLMLIEELTQRTLKIAYERARG